MSIRAVSIALPVGLFLGSAAVQADFQSALNDYKAGRYDAAHAQFLSLAELGDCSSQFNIGAMALQGQGGPKDVASGVGWLEAAAGNGCQQLVGSKVASLSAKLTPDESRAAADIVARFGPEALRAQGILNPDFTCHESTSASVLSGPAAQYPDEFSGQRRQGIVISALTIGTDGHARDPEVLLALPDAAFGAAAVEAWMNTRFAPARRGGESVASRLQAKTVFAVEGGTLANADAFRVARSSADAGDPAAGYLVGLAATLDSSLGISYVRAGQLLLGSARDGDSQAQYWVGSQLRATSACHPRADGAVWLRHAADGGNAPAQVLLAGDLLQGNPGAAQITEARALLAKAASADSYYARKHAAALLAASPVEAVRDPRAALDLALKLSAQPIQSDPQMFETIAAAYAASGDFHNAVAQQQRAVGKAQSLGWDTRRMDERLADYRHGRPWRGDLFSG
jgi:TonB family protein